MKVLSKIKHDYPVDIRLSQDEVIVLLSAIEAAQILKNGNDFTSRQELVEPLYEALDKIDSEYEIDYATN